MRFFKIYGAIFGILMLLTACGGGQGSVESGERRSADFKIEFEDARSASRAKADIHLLEMVLTPDSSSYPVQAIDITSVLNGGNASVTGLQDYVTYYVKILGYDSGNAVIYVGNGVITIQPGTNVLEILCRVNSGTTYSDSVPTITACATDVDGGNQVFHLAAQGSGISSAYVNGSSYAGMMNIKSSAADNGNSVDFSTISASPQELFNDGLHLDVNANDDMWVTAFDSAITSAGDTFDFLVKYTNVFGGADIVRGTTSVGHVYFNFPVITTTTPNVPDNDSLTINWTLPTNSAPDDYTEVHVLYKSDDLAVNRDVVLSASATSYVIPASDLLPGRHYRVAVTIQAGVCDIGQSADYEFDVYAAGSVFNFSRSYAGLGADSGTSMMPTSDGGYIIGGQTNNGSDADSLVIKTGNSGVVEWQRIYASAQDDWIVDIIQTSDGGYLFCGNDVDSDGVGFYNGKVVKLDNSGNILWSKYYGDSGTIDIFNSCIELSNGNYMIAGYTNSYFGEVEGWLIETDPNGNTQKTITYNATISTGDHMFFYDVTELSGGNIALSGYVNQSADYDGIILILDSSGAYNSGRRINFGAAGVGEYIRSISTSADGNLIFTGGYDNTTATGAYGKASSVDGSLLWIRGYGPAASTVALQGMFEASNGDFLISGTANTNHGYIFRTDSAGVEIWQRDFNATANNSNLGSMNATSDGGYVVSGKRDDSGDGGDVWLLKLDSNLQLGVMGLAGIETPVDLSGVTDSNFTLNGSADRSASTNANGTNMIPLLTVADPSLITNTQVAP